MPLKLTFSKVVVLGFNRKPASGTVKISCAVTKAVTKAMEWGEVPDWQKSSAPAGELTASVIEFIPMKPDLQKHAFELAGAGKVRDFEFVRTQVKKGKTASKSPTFRIELHCSVDFTDARGAMKLEAYQQTVDESQMRVTYEKAATQDDLPMATDEQRQAVLAEDE